MIPWSWKLKTGGNNWFFWPNILMFCKHVCLYINNWVKTNEIKHEIPWLFHDLNTFFTPMTWNPNLKFHDHVNPANNGKIMTVWRLASFHAKWHYDNHNPLPVLVGRKCFSSKLLHHPSWGEECCWQRLIFDHSHSLECLLTRNNIWVPRVINFKFPLQPH